LGVIIVMVLPNYTYKAKITNVVDGDTIDADIDVGFRVKMNHRLRLNSVNTCELHSAVAEERAKAVEAKEFVINALLGKDVVITTLKSDAFGRYLAEVYYMKGSVQMCINDELLDSGLAVLFK